VLSILAGLLGIYVLWPQLEFSVGESFDKTDPLETRFVATNKSVYSLRDVHYDCVFKPKYLFQNTVIPQVGSQAFQIKCRYAVEFVLRSIILVVSKCKFGIDGNQRLLQDSDYLS
jgi:hypothetical protein